MRAKVSWVAANRFVGAADSGHGVIMESKSDEGPAIGSSPMEMVLLALGGCSSVDIVEILRKMRLDLRALEVAIHAERAPEAPRVFVKADLEFVGEGADLTQEAMKRAVDLSMDKYCSVAAMLKRSGCAVTYRFRVREAGVGAEGEAPIKAVGAPVGQAPGEMHPTPTRDVPFPGEPGPRPHGGEHDGP
jgi:putative redox protein